MSKYVEFTYAWCLLIFNGLAFILLYESFFMLLETNIAKLLTDEKVIESIKVNDFYNTNTAFRTYFFER